MDKTFAVKSYPRIQLAGGILLTVTPRLYLCTNGAMFNIGDTVLANVGNFFLVGEIC